MWEALAALAALAVQVAWVAGSGAERLQQAESRFQIEDLSSVLCRPLAFLSKPQLQQQRGNLTWWRAVYQASHGSFWDCKQKRLKWLSAWPESRG